MRRPTRRFAGGTLEGRRSTTTAPGVLVLGVLVVVFGLFGLLAQGAEWALVIAGIVAVVALIGATARRVRHDGEAGT